MHLVGSVPGPIRALLCLFSVKSHYLMGIENPQGDEISLAWGLRARWLFRHKSYSTDLQLDQSLRILAAVVLPEEEWLR